MIVKTHHNKMATMLMIAVLALLFLNNVVCSQKPDGGYNHVSPMRQGDALGRYRKQARSKPTAFGSTTDAKFSLENVALRTEGSSQVGKKEKDKITKLPGQPDVNFKQYGGYVTVDEVSGRALFYYFVEAPGAYASTMPLLLWLNGGPGCSSLAYGAMEELGPFRVHSDGKTLYRNPYSWNKVANVLFLESPAGVGFSYSNTTSDYQMSGDSRTAEDAYVFLVNWLKRFPEYKNRDFYIAGESYAGHYVPQLAHVIHQFNQLPKANTINLKGIIIGNGVINDGTDDKGMFDYVWTHALISDEEIANVNKNCDFSEGIDTSVKCNNASSVYQDLTYEIDIYNIYGPICMSTNLTDRPTRPRIKNFDPCHGYYVINYLNIPEVQEALHANVTKKVEGPWSPCSPLPWQDQDKTVLPLLKEFISSGIRVWIFSGDVDGRVPVTSTKYSLNAMNLTVATPWTAWYANKEVGGYSLVYKGNLTFATVRGAGHEVPSYQPYRAFVLAKHFLDGKPLPTS